MNDLETKRCAELREENRLLCLDISRRFLKALQLQRPSDEAAFFIADMMRPGNVISDSLREWVQDCIRVEGSPPSDYRLQLMIQRGLFLVLRYFDAARGKRPLQKLREFLFVEARALWVEPIAGMSIADTARMLGVSPAKHHAQVKKMADFMGCPLPGQRGERASETARKNALRKHAVDRGDDETAKKLTESILDEDDSENEFFKPTADEYAEFKAAERDRVERERRKKSGGGLS